MRVLVVLSNPVEAGLVRHRCEGLVAEGHDLAVCYVMASQVTLKAALDAQRKVTAALRRALEGSAENIPVFVVSQVDGDGIAECAREWGATEVRT
jgi:hypothetical protein